MYKIILLTLLILIISCGGGGGGSQDNKPTVTLVWDEAPPEDNISGYRLYLGYQSKNYTSYTDTGKRNSITIELERNTTYYFACTSYVQDTNEIIESEFSEELEYKTN